MREILFIDNTAHHLYGYLNIMLACKKAGYAISILVPNDGKYFTYLSNAGFDCYSIELDGYSTNILNEFKLLQTYKTKLMIIKPDVICSFTIKPNLYGAIAARKYNILFIANISGLGHAFMYNGLFYQLIVQLYRFAFKKVSCVFFQNKEQQQLFYKLRIINKHKLSYCLPGDGVDLRKFYFVGYTNVNNEEIKFLYVGRLLWDKGIGELIDAYRLVKTQYPQSRMVFIGGYSPSSPSAIKEEQILAWQSELGIEYLGMLDNVSEIIAANDCVLLPSYQEGMPRAILEASSMGKPVIATNIAGCRDAVDHGITGFLCKVKNANDLAEQMFKFIRLPFNKKQQIGIAGRKKMELEFNQNIVVNTYKNFIQQLFNDL